MSFWTCSLAWFLYYFWCKKVCVPSASMICFSNWLFLSRIVVSKTSANLRLFAMRYARYRLQIVREECKIYFGAVSVYLCVLRKFVFFFIKLVFYLHLCKTDKYTQYTADGTKNWTFTFDFFDVRLKQRTLFLGFFTSSPSVSS